MINISIGIMAYNEEANIGRLLERLKVQKTKKAKIKEIIVIASGCTDATEEIVHKKIKKNPKIKLLIQKKREGKARAVNLFIKIAKSPVLVMISADTLPKNEAIDKLAEPFSKMNVGMTAAQIIPVNKQDNFIGFYVKTLWQLHHEVAKRFYKAGELVAWRNIIPGIDRQTSTDETNITSLILKQGLKTVYVPGAIVYNRGPENLDDFIKVRRRQLAAYYHLKEVVGTHYLPPTLNSLLVLNLFLTKIKPKNFKERIWLIGVVLLEGLGKLVAWYDWRIKKDHHPVWPMAESTKALPS